MATRLAISGVLTGGEREIRIGRHVAYGEVSADGRTYSLNHAPTQADFDAIADALAGATPTEIREAIAGPSFVNGRGEIVMPDEI